MSATQDPRDRSRAEWTRPVLHGEAVLDRARQVGKQIVERVACAVADARLDRAAMKDDTAEHAPLT